MSVAGTAIPLTDPSLEAELFENFTRGDYTGRALFFVCPVCLEQNGGKRPGVHGHVVPFEKTGRRSKDTLVWANPSGSTLDDLTLTPSYLATSRGFCRVHVFVTAGKLRILGDSEILIRGTSGHPCESCGQSDKGSTSDLKGFQRCNACGYPSP